jgi:Sulfotransferase domain
MAPRMPADGVVRIAMWSGPRNISTAMMRAFENRPDTAVVDEPFYGYYLARTGIDHPGRDEIIAAMDCDWRSVAVALTHATPTACRVFYQKHMTHHMLDEVDLSFTASLTNCFLVRDPARMIASYAKVRPAFTLADLGLPQQLRIFEHVRAAAGAKPFVVDAAAVLANPRNELRRLCGYVGIDFDERMLHWPAGPRASDGVWARYWYDAVVRSTGFQAPRDEPVEVSRGYADVYAEALDIYRTLASP